LWTFERLEHFVRFDLKINHVPPTMLPSKIIDKGFLIKKSMFIAAALSCLIALIFDCVAMATDNWIVSQACNVGNMSFH